MGHYISRSTVDFLNSDFSNLADKVLIGNQVGRSDFKERLKCDFTYQGVDVVVAPHSQLERGGESAVFHRDGGDVDLLDHARVGHNLGKITLVVFERVERG